MANRLLGTAPALQEKVERVLEAMKALGFPMMVVEGLRTQERQQELWAQGRTKPGPIVTYRDGVTKRSEHQAKGDGLGYAVDCCFLVDGKPSWDLRLPWKVYGEAAKALGLVWGGDWTSLVDLPHIELPYHPGGK